MSPGDYARQLRAELHLSGPVNPDCVAEQLRIAIFEEPLDADGYLLRKGEDTRILVDSGIGYETRKRFTVAHEIGHFFMPHHQAEVFRCVGRDIQSYKSNKKQENEANEFAAELLLPTAELDSLLLHPPTMDLIQEFSELYGTSLTATAVKIAEVTCERIVIILSDNGEIKWFRKSSSFPYWINKGPLHKWIYAYDYFVDGHLADGPQKALAYAWCQVTSPDLYVIEESVAFNRLGLVLTLLHIPVDENEDEVDSF